jgi:hypothetical protein
MHGPLGQNHFILPAMVSMWTEPFHPAGHSFLCGQNHFILLAMVYRVDRTISSCWPWFSVWTEPYHPVSHGFPCGQNHFILLAMVFRVDRTISSCWPWFSMWTEPFPVLAGWYSITGSRQIHHRLN